jgi:hypothetical protein
MKILWWFFNLSVLMFYLRQANLSLSLTTTTGAWRPGGFTTGEIASSNHLVGRWSGLQSRFGLCGEEGNLCFWEWNLGRLGRRQVTTTELSRSCVVSLKCNIPVCYRRRKGIYTEWETSKELNTYGGCALILSLYFKCANSFKKMEVVKPILQLCLSTFYTTRNTFSIS